MIHANCPRCFGPLEESSGRCLAHGQVPPYFSRRPSQLALEAVRQTSDVPVWVPWPLPAGWLVTGFGVAGDDRTGVKASAVALTGPSLTDGPADLLLISEDPGVGLGAAYAGLTGPDPGEGVGTGVPHAKLGAHGHPTPMWVVEDVPDDRAVYAGEAAGRWLWAVAWPAEAGAIVALAGLALADLRELEWDVPFGAPSPRLG